MTTDRTIIEYLDAHYDLLAAHALAIWANPEVALQERFASKRIADELAANGFEVAWGAGGMDTAFVASWGSGGPIIGLLGEYDALPSLSQAATPDRQELVPGGPGHGCGHNLYGVAVLGAALAMKDAMQAGGIAGTVRYYGCPAEETLTGKTYMARDGVFDDLDAAITWHPGYVNGVWASSSLAMNSFKVHFHGIAAHGGGAPHRGRSALDGAMLMDVGVNYLREHVEQDTRIHSVITNGGGAPNVVPPEATIWYFVRAPKRDQVDAIYARMLDCAKGAALMSGTTYDVEFLTGCHELLPNGVIGGVMLDKMEALGGPAFSSDELEFARALQATLDAETIEADRRAVLDAAAEGTTAEDIGAVLCAKVIRPSANGGLNHGSTEVGDVSKIAPTANLLTCCHPLGTPGHSWQITASAGAGVGLRGMDFAAKTMALTGMELLTNREALAAARAEFVSATRGQPYVSPLPADAVPR